VTSGEQKLRAELLGIATKLATQAGTMALTGRRAGLTDVQTKSTATDMVTEFDRASELMIVEGLTKLRPNDAIVGEEGASRPGTTGITWYIDPIDGTSNFLYALPNWAVSIGATDESLTRSGSATNQASGLPPTSIVGAVFIAAQNEMFTATLGGGAHLNGVEIHCNDTSLLTQALVSTGFSYAPEQRTVQATRVAKMIHQIRDIRRFGAASIDLCYVACGRFDAYFEENLHPWDVVAGQLIATEAGCTTGNYSGGAMTPAQTLVSTPAIFGQLGALITSCLAPTRQ